MNKNVIYLFLCCYLLMFLASFNKIFTFIGIGLIIILSICIAFMNKEKNSNVVFLLFLMLVLQNICIGLGAHLNNNLDNSLSYITQFPFIMISVIWGINFIKNKNVKLKSRKWFILYLCYIIFSLFLGKGGLISILMCLRNLIVFYMSYEIGFFYLNNMNKLNSFCKKYLIVMRILFICGIILLIGGYSMYLAIGYNEVYIAKGSTLVEGRLDGRFFTRLFYSMIPRMGSIIYEPVNLAYFFAFGILITFFFFRKNNQKWKFDFLINVLGLILTVGKGGMFIIGLTSMFVIGYKILLTFFKKINHIFLSRLCILLVCFGMFVLIKIYLIKFPYSSVVPHFWGIENGIKSVLQNPLGHGLGTGGNMAYLSGTKYVNNGSESGLMTILYQIGIVGFIFFVKTFLSLLDFNENSSIDKKLFNMFLFVKYIPVAILITALFQENTFVPQCITYYMIFVGGVNHIIYDKQKKESDFNDS